MPAAVVATGHTASNVRSTQLAGTDSDSCATAKVTRPSLIDADSVVGPPFLTDETHSGHHESRERAGEQFFVAAHRGVADAVREHVHFGGSEPAFGLRELHGTVDDGAHGHSQAGYRHFVA